MNLVLALLLAFPGTRIANLPTGRTLAAGTWQLGIGHRWLSAADNDILRGNLMNLVTNANVLVTADYGVTDDLAVGAFGGNGSHAAGLRAGFAATRWTTVYAGAWTDVVDIGLDNTWVNLGIAVPWTVGRRFHFVVLPRVATNFSDRILSVGAGARAALGNGFSLGLETEPVLVGERDLLAWNLSLDKELGWHNFSLTAGNAWHQVEPLWYTTANRDVTRGRFRVGFNILRKF
jgi:hypothetical protein